MSILRSIIAVILGYVIFGISAVLLFNVAGIDPHADPSTGFLIRALSVGFLFSFFGGTATQAISKTGRMTVNYVLAALIAGFAAFSLFMTSGNHYSQWAAIFLFAPASLLGGWAYLRRLSN